MTNVLLLTQTAPSTEGGLHIPMAAQIAIIVLCLASPYLIHRYTGKSLAEWLRLDTLLNVIRGRKAKQEAKKAPQKKSKSAADIVRKASDPELKSFDTETKTKETRTKAQAQEQAASVASTTPAAQGKERNSTKGDLSKFILDLLTVTRKKKLFLLLPGGVRYQNEIASLTAIVVTRKSVIGLNTFGFGGTIQARANDSTWTQRMNGEAKEIKNPTKANEANARILRGALDSIGLSHVPVETAEIFTAQTLTLKGGKPRSLYTRDEFFAMLTSEEHLKGSVDPKAVGKALDELIPKTAKK